MNYEPEIYLITRTYQTRHENSPIINRFYNPDIMLHKGKKNINNKYQGKFRISVLDLNLLKYAINKDSYIKNNVNKILVITCMDYVSGLYSFVMDGVLAKFSNVSEFARTVAENLEIKNVLLNFGEYSEKYYNVIIIEEIKNVR